ncbi:enoyl-CoA hydratase/isomerase family protein [Nocardioides sp. Root190]|uniref:enoyl-CoA hydratase/isomerase family protein n=1 Tax=Nocardioides sp. Root190 TaxID=1736488 RepID=UPI000B209949|nr:enoyl-CoA hydratase/isomerase family protein [Nocardioides sp. Root190]
MPAPLPQVCLDEVDWADRAGVTALAASLPAGPVVGMASSPLPQEAAPLLERLSFTFAPAGPGRTWVAVEPHPVVVPSGPARVLDDLLRATEDLRVPDALAMESMAYSLLLAGPDFGAWRAATPRREVPVPPEPVTVRREHDAPGVLEVELNVPERHNALARAVRDALVEALEIARWDDSVHQVRLTGAGPSFCSGGDLDEFGTATDPVAAHAVRMEASAGLAVHRLRDRVRPVLHGACVGAGIEVTAFAAHLTARDGAWFGLPELGFGLVPGAGGTVSLPRRIGRWRTAYLALTGVRLDLDTALGWGLVDGRE